MGANAEMAQALRNFAAAVESGDVLAEPTACAVAMVNASGDVKATYIGRMVPSRDAGIALLACGIQRLATHQGGA